MSKIEDNNCLIFAKQSIIFLFGMNVFTFVFFILFHVFLTAVVSNVILNWLIPLIPSLFLLVWVWNEGLTQSVLTKEGVSINSLFSKLTYEWNQVAELNVEQHPAKYNRIIFFYSLIIKDSQNKIGLTNDESGNCRGLESFIQENAPNVKVIYK